MSDSTTLPKNQYSVTDTPTPVVPGDDNGVAGVNKSATSLQLGVMILVLGASAGMLFYTKRTGSMLQSLDKLSVNQMGIRSPTKFGPPTKPEWEKLRPRIDKDEFF
jgi:hypothetical protein